MKQPTLLLLAGDIGATNSRLVLYEATSDNRLTSIRQDIYASKEHSSLQEILRKFRASLPRTPDLACFGVPGPVKSGISVTTNLPWQVNILEIERELRVQKVWLLNDLEAIAHGIPHLEDRDLLPLNSVPWVSEGNQAVIAPGSGLGEAGIYWDGTRHHPFGSEGGHCAFAPRDKEGIDILEYLLKKYSRVSWERILSGPGIVHLYSFLRDSGKAREPSWLKDEFLRHDPAQVITEAAVSGKAEICRKTIDLFLDLLAQEAGALALKMMATGGVFIGGGIVPRILSILDKQRFQENFVRQGRLSKALETIPVRVINHSDAGMIGAARHALEQVLKIDQAA